MTKPKELQDIIRLTNRINQSLNTAKRLNLNRVTMDISDTEELLSLLSDSIKTLEQFDLVEFDHTITPERNNHARISNKR